MDCRYLYLTNNQLEELRDGIADGKLWSIIYCYLKEPEEFCDYIEETELNARSIDLMDLELGQNIDTAKSVFVAKIAVANDNRVEDMVELIKDEMLSQIQPFDIFYLFFCTPEEDLITDDEANVLIDLLGDRLKDNSIVNWVRNYDIREEGFTDLYMVGIEKGKLIDDEDEVIDEILDEINDLDFGEYRDVLIKNADQHAKNTIGDLESYKDAVVACMLDYLHGASEALKLVSKNTKKSKSGK